MPSSERIEDLLDLAYLKYRNHTDGSLADYIPILKQADPHWFGITVAQPNGKTFTRGDIDIAFSIQSISKAFTFALACERFGHDYVHQRIGFLILAGVSAIAAIPASRLPRYRAQELCSQ